MVIYYFWSLTVLFKYEFDFQTGKLQSRSQKIAYALLNRVGFKPTDVNVKPGDRIALVYPNNDPLNFMCAFYGCVMAGVVPVPIEVPLTRRVSFSSKLYDVTNNLSNHFVFYRMPVHSK